jgi:hypothetical protein
MYTSQSSAQQQSSFRPPAPRGRGARGFGERFGDQPRKIYFLFCGEDKGHTTRMCQITIQKQKEIAEAEARQSQPKQVLHIASCHSPYIPEYVGNHHAAYVPSEREMCPWAISKYFGDLVSKQVLKCKMVDKVQTKDEGMFLRLSTLFYGLMYCV